MRTGANRWVALALLPAAVLSCVLMGNWAAGGAAVEALQALGVPLLVDVEPDAPVRIVGSEDGLGSFQVCPRMSGCASRVLLPRGSTRQQNSRLI